MLAVYRGVAATASVVHRAAPYTQRQLQAHSRTAWHAFLGTHSSPPRQLVQHQQHQQQANDSVWRTRFTWLIGGLLAVGAGMPVFLQCTDIGMSLRKQLSDQRDKTAAARVENMLARLETQFHGVQPRHTEETIFCDARFERDELASLLAQFQPTSPGGHAAILQGASCSGKSYAVCAALEGQQGVVHLVLRNVLKERFIEELAPQIGYFDGKDESQMQSTLTVHGLVSKLMTAVDQFRQAHPGQRVRVIIEDIHTCIDRDKLNGAPPRQLHDAAAELLGALVQPLRDGRINMLFTVSESAGVRLILQESGLSRTRVVAFPSIDDAHMQQQLMRLCIRADKLAGAPQQLRQVGERKPNFVLSAAGESAPGGYLRVFHHVESAATVVRSVGSHMADLNDVLQRYCESHQCGDGGPAEKARVIAAVQPTMHAQEAVLLAALQPTVPLAQCDHPKRDPPYIAALQAVVARIVCDELRAQAHAREKANPLHASAEVAASERGVEFEPLVHARVHGVRPELVRAIMAELVEKKIFATPVRSSYAVFYSRAMQVAYSELAAQNKRTLDDEFNRQINVASLRVWWWPWG